MTEIGSQLRAARLAQGRSLEDVAAATRINAKFLSSIEEGVVPNLPMTYIRAFVKGYAMEVGLNAEEMLARLAASTTTEQKEPEGENKPAKEAVPSQSAAGSRPHTRRHEPSPAATREKATTPSRSGQTRVLVALVILIVIGFSVSVIWLRQEHLSQQPQEISFADAVKEQEAKLNPAPKPADTLQQANAIPPAAVGPSSTDSLSLEGIASDSVWVRVSADGGSATESILAPLAHKHWKAKNTFTLSVGNASAISFSLNGQKLGVLGTSKKPLKNITFSRETLTKHPVTDSQKPPNAKP